MSDWKRENYDDQYGRPCMRISTPDNRFRIEAVLERNGEVAVYEGTLCVLSFDHNYPGGAAQALSVVAARQYLSADVS